jgi:hypothetical protein
VSNIRQQTIVNAERLACDARLLFTHERFKTSIALSILSFEESGKFYILGFKTQLIPNRQRHHISKQDVASSTAIVESGLVAYYDYLSRKGYVQKRKSELSPREKWWLNSAEGREFRASDLIEESMDSVMMAVEAAGSVEDQRLAITGDIQRLKHAGFYVDEEPSKTLPDDPASLANVAREWLLRAEHAVARARRTFAKGKDTHDLVIVLRDDLIENTPM